MPSTPDEQQTTAHHEPSAPVGYLELFYDLVFVAATMLLSNEFSHDPTFNGAWTCALMFVMLWLLWFHTTVLMNVERRDDLGQRGLVFAQMFLIFLATLLFVDHSVTSVDLVGVAYLGAVLVVAYAHHRIRNESDPIGAWAVSRRNRLLLAGVAMALDVLIQSDLGYVMFGIAIALLIVPTSLSQRGVPVPAVDEHHLAERAALLTIIVMGESFVKAALVVSSGSITGWDVVTIAVMFVMLLGLFSVYFDDVPKAGIRPGVLAGELWLLAHLVLQISIVGLAIGISKYLQISTGPVPEVGVVVLTWSYAGVFVGLALIGELDRRLPRGRLVGLQVASAAAAIVGGVATVWYDLISPGTFLLLLAALAIVNAFVGDRLRRSTRVVPIVESVVVTIGNGESGMGNGMGNRNEL